MDGLAGRIHCPVCGSWAGLGCAGRAGGKAKGFPKAVCGEQRPAGEGLEARQGRNAGPQRQEEADIFAGEIHDLDGNLVARLQAGDFDLLQAGIKLAAGGNCQAGSPLEIHALQAFRAGAGILLTMQDDLRAAGGLTFNLIRTSRRTGAGKD